MATMTILETMVANDAHREQQLANAALAIKALEDKGRGLQSRITWMIARRRQGVSMLEAELQRTWQELDQRRDALREARKELGW